MADRDRNVERVVIKGLGKVVADLRKERRWSQDDLAVKMHASRPWVASVENESRDHIYATYYRRLAEAFGMTPEELDARWKGESRTISYALPVALYEQVQAAIQQANTTIDEAAAEAWRAWLKKHAAAAEDSLPHDGDTPMKIEPRGQNRLRNAARGVSSVTRRPRPPRDVPGPDE